MGSKMRHDAIKVLFARAFKQAGFKVQMEQDGGLLDRRRPGDVEVEDWVVISNWKENTSLTIDVAIIDPTADSHSARLRKEGVGAAATKYEDRKRKTYSDIKGKFSPFVLETHGGYGKEAKRLVRELEKRRKERQCLPNVRGSKAFQQLGDISLVTAISFELVRRNVRMILDRMPEEEPLIPGERTKIRLEMVRKKKGMDGSSQAIFSEKALCERKPDADERLENRDEAKVSPVKTGVEGRHETKISSIDKACDKLAGQNLGRNISKALKRDAGCACTNKSLNSPQSGSLDLCDVNKASATEKAMNINGEMTEKLLMTKQNDHPSFPLRAWKDKLSTRVKKDTNTETSEGDATNTNANESAPHLTGACYSEDLKTDGARAQEATNSKGINIEENVRNYPLDEAKMEGPENPNEENRKSNNNNYKRSMNKVNTKLFSLAQTGL